MKRWVIIITSCILVGAIINVAVAWWFTIWGDEGANSDSITQYGRSYGKPESGEWYVETIIGSGFTFSLSAINVRSTERDERELTAEEVLTYYWVDSLRLDPDTISMYSQGMYCGLAHGWPFRSMMIIAGPGFDDKDIFLRGLPWSAPSWPVDRSTSPGLTSYPIYLPLNIIWPGFIANTLLYAMMFYSIFFMPFKLRYLFRTKRKQCTKCGYPIGQSEVCTECGTQLILKRQRQ